MVRYLFLAVMLAGASIAESQQVSNADRVKQLAAGANHSMVLLTDGTIRAWGKNSSGQLGDSTTVDKTAPVKIGRDTTWNYIAAGNNISYGIKTDGSLWGWGTNKVGQLGMSTRNFIYDYWAPIQIGTAIDWKTVCPAVSFTVGLKKDGTIWAWGNKLDNLQDQESNPYQPVKLSGNDNSNWTAIASGDDFFIAQKNDGTLWTRGKLNETLHNDGGKTIFYKVNNDTDWTSFVAGSQHVMALKKDGSLWGWGNNEVGQLGNGSNSTSKDPVKLIRINDWKTIAAAGDYSIALKNDGSVWYWGRTFFKQDKVKYSATPKTFGAKPGYGNIAAATSRVLMAEDKDAVRSIIESYEFRDKGKYSIILE
jgi:alpha-tubulin suppressor-like RCC1 family protein